MPQKGTGISKAFQVLRQNLEGGKPDLYVIASKDIGMGILDLHVEKGQKKMNILWQGENQANPVYQPAEETPFGRSHHIAVGQLLSREVVNRWLTMESEGNNRAAVY